MIGDQRLHYYLAGIGDIVLALPAWVAMAGTGTNPFVCDCVWSSFCSLSCWTDWLRLTSGAECIARIGELALTCTRGLGREGSLHLRLLAFLLVVLRVGLLGIRSRT